MGKFTGKVALVTASTEGIGFAIARRLGQDGAHVVVCSRKEANVNKAIQTLKSEDISVSGMPCHVGKPSDRKALLDKIRNEQGGIDILVCNAAVNPQTGNLLKVTESVYDKIFDLNVKSTFMLIQEALPLMESREKPSIVTVASWAGVLVTRRMSGLYAVSKSAIISLTKSLSFDLGLKNIRINCLAPGLITTKFSEVLKDTEDQLKAISAVKRPGVAEECAGTVSYFCSDDASFVTGETIIVSGGLPARL